MIASLQKANRSLSSRIGNLTEREAEFIDHCQAYHHRFRIGKTVPVRLIRFGLCVYLNWEKDEFRAVFDSLIANGIIERTKEQSHFRLIGCFYADGSTEFKEPPKPDADCAYCGKRLPPEKQTRDHIIPRSQGGGGEGNYVIACAQCNETKNDRTPEQWARDILNYRRRPKPKRTKPSRLARFLVQIRLRFVIAIRRTEKNRGVC